MTYRGAFRPWPCVARTDEELASENPNIKLIRDIIGNDNKWPTDMYKEFIIKTIYGVERFHGTHSDDNPILEQIPDGLLKTRVFHSYYRDSIVYIEIR